jgi:hypothetical protein
MKGDLKSFAGFAFRKDSRKWLKAQPRFAFLFEVGVERDKLDGEDSEPEEAF